jgi:predicted ATPase
MMQTLEVKNFVTIKEAKIDLKPFVVIIGPQASGKSLLAKITYFIKEFLFSDFVSALQKDNTWKKFQEEETKKFQSIFPEYIWKKSKFEIVYRLNDSYIRITNRIADDGSNLTIDCSGDIEKKYKLIREQFKEEYSHVKQIEATKDNFPDMDKFVMFRRVFLKNINDIKELFFHAIFIPAGRAFFSNIKKNIFSFMSKELEIDYFLKEFGSVLEGVKDVYEHIPSFSEEKHLREEIYKLNDEILCGKYVHWKDEDWIEKDKIRIRLVNSSSGQQESWPLLVILTFYNIVGHYLVDRRSFFIEEPEAHLFPLSQKKIVDLIGLIYNAKKDNQYFLTTHSPYILSSLNNLILSHHTNNDKLKRKSIPFNDVAAYALEGGVLKDIKDYEDEIIDARYIDQVSSCIEREFNEIVEGMS